MGGGFVKSWHSRRKCGGKVTVRGQTSIGCVCVWGGGGGGGNNLFGF